MAGERFWNTYRFAPVLIKGSYIFQKPPGRRSTRLVNPGYELRRKRGGWRLAVPGPVIRGKMPETGETVVPRDCR
jgi:hypothetical protein